MFIIFISISILFSIASWHFTVALTISFIKEKRKVNEINDHITKMNKVDKNEPLEYLDDNYAFRELIMSYLISISISVCMLIIVLNWYE